VDATLLGVPALSCRQPSAFDSADIDFPQVVADQLAVAVENALAFQEIDSLKDKPSPEKAYQEEEVRAEHNFGEIVGDSAGLRRILKDVETVAPTDFTVLIRGESGAGKELRRCNILYRPWVGCRARHVADTQARV